MGADPLIQFQEREAKNPHSQSDDAFRATQRNSKAGSRNSFLKYFNSTVKGITVAKGRPVTSPIERFMVKVEKTSTCWFFTGSLNPKGYGRFYDGVRLVQAHRFSYEHFKNEITPGRQLDHKCRNRNCVNPEHLEEVSCRENLLKGNTIASANFSKVKCKRGHEFNSANTYISPKGSRECRICRNA